MSTIKTKIGVGIRSASSQNATSSSSSSSSSSFISSSSSISSSSFSSSIIEPPTNPLVELPSLPEIENSEETFFNLADSFKTINSLRGRRKGSKNKPKDQKREKYSIEESQLSSSSQLQSLTQSTSQSAQSMTSTFQIKPKQDQGPRVEIINGKIVVNESSLIIPHQDTTAEGEYEEVFESLVPTSRYSSFKNQKASTFWGLEETKIFYNALSQCGTNFSLLQTFLPNRTRKEIKNKFHREEKAHPELINSFLNSPTPLDITPFNIQWGENILPNGIPNEDIIVEKVEEQIKEKISNVEKAKIEEKEEPTNVELAEKEIKKKQKVENKRKEQEKEEIVGMIDSDEETKNLTSNISSTTNVNNTIKLNKPFPPSIQPKKRGATPSFAPNLKRK